MSQFWLDRLCKRRGESTKPVVVRPYLLDGPQGPLTAATDARVAVFLAGAHGEAKPPDADASKVTEQLLPLWEPKGKPEWTGTLAELKAFTGPAAWDMPCSACKGTSKNSEYVHCAYCDGHGRELPDPRRGWLQDVPVDLNLLAIALNGITEDCPVTVYVDGPERPLWLVADVWRIVLQPMSAKNAPEEWKTAQRLRTEKAGGA